jgi:hypothetical protein
MLPSAAQSSTQTEQTSKNEQALAAGEEQKGGKQDGET